MISLVDCNNFYASCERVFQPSLENKPVLILSNNDGCVIARSNEVKALGIKMGQPYFEIKNMCQTLGINVFSSNYTLYSDMSSRVMAVLKDFAVRQEIYSIDEAFLDVTGIRDLVEHGQKIRAIVKQYVGLPVCVGTGRTKVLAKFANHLAKKHPFLNGVCDLNTLGNERTNKAMKLTNVKEVWGIGSKIATRMSLMGINTIYDLKIADPKHLRRIFNINIEKLIHELNGTRCIELEEYQDPNKQIVCSRSFGIGTNNKNDLLSSISYHLEQGSQKLRKQGLFARKLTIFINSNRFKDDYYYNATTIDLPQALDSFRLLAKYIEITVDKLYRPEIRYKKSGIILTELISNEFETVDLFDFISINHDQVLPCVESIKRKYGKSSINLAMSKLSNGWKMQQDHITKHYTTDIKGLIIAI
jgi:DNA polymerase V